MSIADELRKLAELRDSGVLSEPEFQQQKARVLAQEGKAAPSSPQAEPEKQRRSVLGPILLAALLVFGALIVIGALSDDEGAPAQAASLDGGVEGRLSVDSGTEYVFYRRPSAISGACAGWNEVAVQRSGGSSGGMTNLMCWKIVRGELHTQTQAGGQPVIAPLSSIR